MIVKVGVTLIPFLNIGKGWRYHPYNVFGENVRLAIKNDLDL